MALRFQLPIPHTGIMLEMKAAIKFLKSELRGVNEAINNFEVIAGDQYADRMKRANQKLAKARYRQSKGAGEVSEFLITPPRQLDPDACLRLQ
jgi:hypothetical protein